MNFACELMDLCRGTQEVEAVLSEGSDCNFDNGKRDPLARLKMAIRYQEKKVGLKVETVSPTRNLSSNTPDICMPVVATRNRAGVFLNSIKGSHFFHEQGTVP